MDARLALVVMLLPLVASVRAATVAYPFNFFGDTWTREPFALNELNLTSCRYQQVYDADRFAAVLPDGLTITQVQFVVDNEFPRGFNTVFPDIQVDLSVTLRVPDQLSTNFSDNLGTNTVTVFPRGKLEMKSDGGSGIIAPSIPLVVPFFYKPALGNLLLDIRIYLPNPQNPSGNPGVFDAFDLGSDSVSRVFSPDVNCPTGVADTRGLMTIFKVIPPSTPRLLLFSFRTTGADPFLRLRWFRVPGNGNYTLQQSPVLGSGASWQPYGGIVYSYEEYFETRVPVNLNDTARFFRLVSQTSTNAAGHQPDNGPVAVPFLEP